MPKIQPFEEYATEYDGWFVKNKFVYEAELRAIRDLLPKRGTGLEIGVGTGRIAAPLGIKYGLEPASKMREIARARGITVVPGVAEALPFPDAAFDYLLMVTVLCFLDDVRTACREAWRVLKPGGCLLIGFIDKNSKLGKLYEANKMKSKYYHAATFYSGEEFVSFLKEAGFSNFIFRQTIFHQEPKHIEPVQEGSGEGSFVVVKASKKS